MNLEEVPTDVGPLLVHADDQVITPIIRATGTWEPELGEQLRALLKPGMTVVDVGGNIGYTALLMAGLIGRSGRVIAVEPDPRNAEVLRRNAERTAGAPIEIVEAAAWSEPTRLELALHETNTGDHRVGLANNDRKKIIVQALCLDEILTGRVDLILMDTQATEHVALRGALKTLERERPILFVEFWPQGLREAETDPVSVLDGYRALGFRASGAEGPLPEDPGEIVQVIDAAEQPFTTLRLDPIDSGPRRRERLLSPRRRLGRTWARRFPPVEANTLAYDATHRALVGALLDDPSWTELFATGARLPPGLGAGYDERVVEYPWLFAQGLGGRVLDAGSVTNHRHVLQRLLATVDDLVIATLAPEPLSFTSMGASYLYADLRDLPLRDDWFDRIVCLSTLEHVGMDNAFYGADVPRDADPDEEAARALRELLRVVRPGGRIHLSVPFGRHEDHGWFRQFAREDVDSLFERAGVGRREEAVFLHSERGWRRVAAARAADVAYNGESGRAADLAVAARAVFCATIFA